MRSTTTVRGGLWTTGGILFSGVATLASCTGHGPSPTEGVSDPAAQGSVQEKDLAPAAAAGCPGPNICQAYCTNATVGTTRAWISCGAGQTAACGVDCTANPISPTSNCVAAGTNCSVATIYCPGFAAAFSIGCPAGQMAFCACDLGAGSTPACRCDSMDAGY